ncbi:molybdopterin-dependent oxidoreductase [Nocardioides sp.]|uniref:molybdopterin-dependent oxidoreductase n=1 Tax=Nocardioides sp. TaxID=35761 RepID=UPI002B275875|nr:molybdopterin-dependent oxidoreductase [Nocardioides sp.]
MKKSASWWALSGVAAGLVGLAVGYLVSALMNLRLTPVSAVAELVVELAPAAAANNRDLGTAEKPALVVGIYVLLVLAFAGVGLLARERWWPAVAGFAAVALIGALAALSASESQVTDVIPVLLGFGVMVVALSLLADRLRAFEAVTDPQRFAQPYARTRRSFLGTTAAVLGVAALASVVGNVRGGSRRAVEEARRGLAGSGKGLLVTQPQVPADVSIGVDGVASWVTPSDRFYLIDTAFSKPAITPSQWSLRIHGMVDNELVLTYDDLLQRELLEGWVTLNCVSNTVGGDLVGNAWWSGVALAPILAEAGIQAGADAILQTSDDGWNCATPVETVMDGRNAMLALYMNGEPLPVEHGFPVRTIVPGLYGYVSATKWVVDMEVTRFDAVDAFWTQRGWGELGPVKMASRIDVPANGATVQEVDGGVVIAGAAWDQHTGIEGVEVAVDGGAWTAAELAGTPTDDSWTQWRATVPLERGRHRARVRAISKDGEVQTGAVADVLPDGATGWHEVEFTVG